MEYAAEQSQSLLDVKRLAIERSRSVDDVAKLLRDNRIQMREVLKKKNWPSFPETIKHVESYIFDVYYNDSCFIDSKKDLEEEYKILKRLCRKFDLGLRKYRIASIEVDLSWLAMTREILMLPDIMDSLNSDPELLNNLLDWLERPEKNDKNGILEVIKKEESELNEVLQKINKGRGRELKDQHEIEESQLVDQNKRQENQLKDQTEMEATKGRLMLLKNKIALAKSDMFQREEVFYKSYRLQEIIHITTTDYKDLLGKELRNYTDDEFEDEETEDDLQSSA